MNYYNEFDPKSAAWLRELIKEKLIPDGKVDTRSIRDVSASDLDGFTQCHFFAGIGGWSYALALAGWPEDEPVWTGSCPCQPFSCAGKGLAEADERHLWPVFRELIRARQPAIVFGEQVASAAGRVWLSGVFADLEGMAYQRAAADLCAAGIGAPHIRQRLWWLAYAGHGKRGWPPEQESRSHEARERDEKTIQSGGRSATDRLAQSWGGRREVANLDAGFSVAPDGQRKANQPGMPGSARGACWMGEPIQQGLEGHAGNGGNGHQPGRNGSPATRPTAETGSVGGVDQPERTGERGRNEQGHSAHRQQVGELKDGPWGNCDLLPCRDGKSRRVESGTFPLAHGVPGRVGLLRGYGNAIVPQLAAEFIQASVEAIRELKP